MRNGCAFQRFCVLITHTIHHEELTEDFIDDTTTLLYYSPRHKENETCETKKLRSKSET